MDAPTWSTHPAGSGCGSEPMFSAAPLRVTTSFAVCGASTACQALIADAEAASLTNVRSPEVVLTENHSQWPAQPRSYQTIRKG